jgi:DNA-binding transcriptional ArsR family regulator
MSVPAGSKGLRFPCECVSSRPDGYSDPWAEIAKNKLLPNGTKEEILNVLSREPKTITQIAEALSLSAPSVHTHITDLLRSELLREALEWEKTHPAERYYEPNFPVFKAEECEEQRVGHDVRKETSRDETCFPKDGAFEARLGTSRRHSMLIRKHVSRRPYAA